MISPEQEIPIAEFRLVRLDDGHELLVRRMRACDAEHFNRQWHERGIPTRWQAVELQRSAAVA